MGFGLFFMAEYINIVVGCSVATVLFLGGWHPGFFPLPANPWLASLVGFGAFCAKLYTLIFFVMMAREARAS
jgi:NADH-quinone oxidoreductase subunit H